MKVFRQLVIVSSLWCGANSGFAQTWTLTGAATNLDWGCIACSADGTKQVAAGGDIGVWVSTNSGDTWALTSAPVTNDWRAVASSADGTTLAVLDSYYGVIYTSTDSGTAWTKASVPHWTWHSIAISADGTKIVASAADPNFAEYAFASADSGTTWNSNSLPGDVVVSVAVLANGHRLVAAANTGYVLASTNLGATWQSVASGLPYLYSVASSPSGSTLVVGSEGSILVSTNAGATWISNSASAFGDPAIVTHCVASADGTRLAAVATSAIVGYRGAAVILLSTNAGTTWVQADTPIKIWTGIASSADGCKVVGSASLSPFTTPFPSAWSGGIYRAQTTPAPSMKVKATDNNLDLSWIVPSTNFVMQQSADLLDWAVLTNRPVLNPTNLQDEVLLSVPGSNVFYRLKTP